MRAPAGVLLAWCMACCHLRARAYTHTCVHACMHASMNARAHKGLANFPRFLQLPPPLVGRDVIALIKRKNKGQRKSFVFIKK
mmetsp:Transcript_31456/g.81895  ORF Transcript_31456/g.81895 Transcript_31456/m.81895 type:complete len:83 (+) Transcript_31456:217-465(+)